MKSNTGFKVRFRVTVPTNMPDAKNVDSWIVNSDNDVFNDAARTVTKLAYKYMDQVVHDALYDPMVCSLHMYQNVFNRNMPGASIMHDNKRLYLIESFNIFYAGDHIYYRDYIMTVSDNENDASKKTVNIVCVTYHYDKSIVVDDLNDETLNDICEYIDSKYTITDDITGQVLYHNSQVVSTQTTANNNCSCCNGGAAATSNNVDSNAPSEFIEKTNRILSNSIDALLNPNSRSENRSSKRSASGRKMGEKARFIQSHE